MKLCSLAIAALISASAAGADEAEDAFVDANLLSIFYHELGHALIDVMGLPVFGQEEDAADVASILLIDALFDEATAADIAYDAAFGFLAEADAPDGEIAWWDVHGPDEQRFYNLVCLFYGANPEARDDIAQELGLPEDRAAYCPDEFDLANESWGPVWEELEQGDATGKLVLEEGAQSPMAVLVQSEVKATNKTFHFPQDIAVRVESCGEANAFYDPEDQSIIMCTEFESHLRKMFQLIAE